MQRVRDVVRNTLIYALEYGRESEKDANIERKSIEIYQGIGTLEVGGGVKIL